MSRVLVVAAHPDDEVLGGGGAMARHTARGDDVAVVICATGLASRGAVSAAELESLQECTRHAAKVLGVHRDPLFLGFPDNAMDRVPLLDVVKAVEAVVGDFRPDRVYTHHLGDLNIDHRVVAQAVATACRPLPGGHTSDLLAFEVLSSTEWGGGLGPAFSPTHFVRLDEREFGAKLAALECYAGEMRSFPHPRSTMAVEALARLRGSAVGAQWAEGFVTLRTVA